MSKPRKPRVQYETVYRVRIAAGSLDFTSQEDAEIRAEVLRFFGVTNVEVDSFKRLRIKP